jgi:predicted enzyme related to lactoylglutathione lyase
MDAKVAWFEIGARDVDAQRGFYGDLFGWKTDGGDNPIRYESFPPPEEGGGIGGGLWPSPLDGVPYAIFTVQVADVAATAARAEELGAKVVHGPVAGPQIEYAYLTDPEGNRIGLFTPRG